MWIRGKIVVQKINLKLGEEFSGDGLVKQKLEGQLQSWTKPNVNTKKSTFIFPLPPFIPIQCCRSVVVGALAEYSASRCLSHSLINIE